jgi:hypothetical protein
MTKHGNGRLADWETMLREQVSDGAVRRPSLSQFRDDIFCREQILELLWTAGRKFFDRLANCGGVKRGHKLELFGREPGNW